MNDRQLRALTMRDANATYKKIGADLNVTVSRARQIVARAARLRRTNKISDNWTNGLNLKIARSLLAAGFKNKESVFKALNSGKLGINKSTKKGNIPGIAEWSIKQISQWLQN